jgi:DEAD/DEAH box helicase
MQTIKETISQLHSSLQQYIEATYHISLPALISQRKELLNRPSVIHQIPYIESTPRYKTGKSFSVIEGLPPSALQAYHALADAAGALPALLHNPPYKHQSDAILYSLVKGKNLIVMTGTGSGKTESFLLPILGKLALEASTSPTSFRERSAVRAMLLYPMNALVNDQLGRLRSLFGDDRLVALFQKWAQRPARFARYTSRTPYAGLRTRDKDSRKYHAFDEFYVEIHRQAQGPVSDEQQQAKALLQQLKAKGKWPTKPDLIAWFGNKGTDWQDRKTGKFRRAVTLPNDVELITRHEAQEAPPDLLVTNYSMLEYMLMRPIERPIFDRTRDWLEQNPHQKFLIVLDEAHLYRGAAGAEVGLLLRRLRDRLNIPPERFQVICATASFKDAEYALQFGAQLAGVPAESFIAIQGDFDWRSHAAPGSKKDAEILAALDLTAFYAHEDDAGRLKVIEPWLQHRHVAISASLETVLFQSLEEFPPLGLLINTTMKQARPIEELGQALFPDSPKNEADAAATVLMALGSIAISINASTGATSTHPKPIPLPAPSPFLQEQPTSYGNGWSWYPGSRAHGYSLQKTP